MFNTVKSAFGSKAMHWQLLAMLTDFDIGDVLVPSNLLDHKH